MRQYNIIDSLLDYSDTSLDFSREVSCFAIANIFKSDKSDTIIHPGIISCTTSNNAGGVEFDWIHIKNVIWMLKKKNQSPEYVYMLHTHPPMFNRMSSIDRNMVYGWTMALGIPIWFLVLTEDEIAFYICSLNQETKKVERDLVDLSTYEDVCIELRMVAQAMYGASKAKDLENTNLQEIVCSINSSTILWKNIHKWNMIRQWNQVVPMTNEEIELITSDNPT